MTDSAEISDLTSSQYELLISVGVTSSDRYLLINRPCRCSRYISELVENKVKGSSLDFLGSNELNPNLFTQYPNINPKLLSLCKRSKSPNLSFSLVQNPNPRSLSIYHHRLSGNWGFLAFEHWIKAYFRLSFSISPWFEPNFAIFLPKLKVCV